jgi:ABC-type transporter Mla subunit MlaD
LPPHNFHLWCVDAVAAADGSMSETDPIEVASRRLAIALDALEAAAERRGETDRNEQSLATQIHALDSDRARLAGELDRATARSRGLEAANRAVAQRIVAAIDTINTVLAEEQSEKTSEKASLAIRR